MRKNRATVLAMLGGVAGLMACSGLAGVGGVGLERAAFANLVAERAASTLPPGAEALEDTVRALRDFQTLQFKMVRRSDGLGMTYGGEADVAIRREPHGGLTVRITGKTQQALGGEQQVDYLADASTKLDAGRRTVTWVDHRAKRVVQQNSAAGSGPRTEADRIITDVERFLLMPMFFEDPPFRNEANARGASEESPIAFDGTTCQVFRFTFGDPAIQRLVVVSADDRLPRRYEQIRIMDRGGEKVEMKMVWEITGLKLNPGLDDAVFRVETPAGYTFEKREAPAPAAPGSAVPAPPAQPGAGAQPVPVPAPTTGRAVLPGGGLAVGSPVPAFELRLLGLPGQPTTGIRSEELRGAVSLLAFWSPAVPRSAGVLTAAEAIQSQLGRDGLRVFGVAARLASMTGANTDGEQAIRAAWQTHKLSIPAGVARDEILSGMNIRGFPCVVVLARDGTLAAYIEGVSDPAELTTAVQAALARQ
jgi:hypothetical protein